MIEISDLELFGVLFIYLILFNYLKYFLSNAYLCTNNKHFESSQKLLKSSFVNERFKKYLKVPKELLIFETTKLAKTVHLYSKLVLSTPIL